MKKFYWTNHNIINFVNWFLNLHKLPERYKLENQSLIESFKNGDNFKLWQKKHIEMDEKTILIEMKKLLIDLHTKLDSVGPDFDWMEFIDISNECRNLQEELKIIKNI